MQSDGLDILLWFMGMYQMAACVGVFVKADVSRAFRRFPVRFNQLEFPCLVFKAFEVLWIMDNLAANFGHVASVWAWRRVSNLALAVFRWEFPLCMAKYVDDFYGVVRERCKVSANYILSVVMRSFGYLLDPAKCAQFTHACAVLGAKVAWWYERQLASLLRLRGS